MKHADFATTLALLFAISVRAVPARDAAIHAIQVGQQQVPNGSPPLIPLPQGNQQQQQPPPPPPPQPQRNTPDNAPGPEQPKAGPDSARNVLQGGSAGGLVPLPGAPVTTGSLQSLPGAATVVQASSIIAAIPVETSSSSSSAAVVVGTSSAVLGEVVTEVRKYSYRTAALKSPPTKFSNNSPHPPYSLQAQAFNY
jgi:hypothetical protein